MGEGRGGKGGDRLDGEISWKEENEEYYTKTNILFIIYVLCKYSLQLFVKNLKTQLNRLFITVFGMPSSFRIQSNMPNWIDIIRVGFN